MSATYSRPTGVLDRGTFLPVARLEGYQLTRWIRYGIIPRTSTNSRGTMFRPEAAIAARVVLECRERNLSTQIARGLVNAALEAYSEPGKILAVIVQPFAQWKAQPRTARAYAVWPNQVTEFLAAQACGSFIVDIPQLAREIEEYYVRFGVSA